MGQARRWSRMLLVLQPSAHPAFTLARAVRAKRNTQYYYY
jgi:hypothetical protein